MQPREIKLSDHMASCVEDHYFNPAVVGRRLSNQPIYTVDQIMELVVHIIYSMKERYEVEAEGGNTSEGLILANNLHKAIQIVNKKAGFNNITIPNTKQYKANTIENIYQSNDKFWLHGQYNGQAAHINVQAII